MSVLNGILDGVVTMVAGLELPPPVVKRKAPKREAGVDAVEQITVSKSEEPEQYKAFAFGGRMKVRYPIEIALRAPNPDDYLTNLDTYTQWREQIRNLFKPPFASPVIPGVSQVWDLDVEPGVFLDQDEIENLYDYMTIKVWVTTME